MRFLGLNLRLPWSSKVSQTAEPLFRRVGSNEVYGIFPERNFAQYSVDGYKKNVVAFRAISLVARGLAFVPLDVYQGKRKLPETHPLNKLLKRPNPRQGGDKFMESVAAYYLLAGNTYIEGVGPDGENEPPLELWTHRPDYMRLTANALGINGYVFDCGVGAPKKWMADPIDGTSPVLHMRTFNPLDNWYGMSPIEAAAYAIDQHNMAGKWNQALLQNSARPSGALVYSNKDGGTLSDEQFNKLKEELNQAYAGGKNAGRPIILEGNLDWKQMGMSPADMDWIAGKNMSTREITMAYGVPPMLAGIEGDTTFANYAEARQALYEDTVLPLLQSFLEDMNVWLAPKYGQDIQIKMNVQDLPALAPKRAIRWGAVQQADWLTINEKREATGYEPLAIPEADEVFIGSTMQPLTGSTEPPPVDETLPGDPNADPNADPAADPIADPAGDTNPDDVPPAPKPKPKPKPGKA